MITLQCFDTAEKTNEDKAKQPHGLYGQKGREQRRRGGPMPHVQATARSQSQEHARAFPRLC